MVQYTSNVCGQNKTTGLIIIINNKLFFFLSHVQPCITVNKERNIESIN